MKNTTPNIQRPTSTEDLHLLKQRARMGHAHIALGVLIASVLMIVITQYVNGALDDRVAVLCALLVIAGLLSHGSAKKTARNLKTLYRASTKCP